MSDPRNPVTPAGYLARPMPTGGGLRNETPAGDPTHTTNSEQKRGKCPICDREMLLKKDGTLRHHGGKRRGSWNYREYRCVGAGLLPVEPGHVAAWEEALRVDALQSRKDFVERYCTRRIDHREGDFTEQQLAEWQQQAAASWAEKYPAFAKLAPGVDR